MTEESLVLGRPPRPPRRGRWAGRGPAIAVGAALLGLAGWGIWHATVDDSPERGAGPTPPVPTSTGSALVAHEPPRVPYLRSGVLVRPDDLPRGIPDGSWTELAELADGRVALAQKGRLTVLSDADPPLGFPLAGGLTARPDGTAVAWTGPDGRVRRLDTGRAEAVVVRHAQQLVPACRGLRVDGRLRPEWQTCDRDGGLLSPDGRYFASVGSDTVTVAPRADITAGTSFDYPGTILDAVWEDIDHLLVVVDLGGRAHLMRIAAGGGSEDLISPIRGGGDRSRPALVLPLASSWYWTRASVQP